MRIGINCGHTVSGQPGCGAVGYIDESIETRKVGLKLEKILADMGHTVYDCTNDYASSTSANLAEICRMANRQPLDLFVSIHFNSGGGKGTEVFTYGGQRHAEAVAACNKLCELGFTNRGVKDGSTLYVIRHTDAKAMLVEVCFVDSASDVQLYKKLGAEAVAAAIAEAITGQAATNTKTETEGLTMTQYEELTERINSLENKVGKPSEKYNYVDKNLPEWAKDDVQWMLERNIIVGNDKGELELSPIKLWVIAIVARTARYIAKLIGVKM